MALVPVARLSLDCHQLDVGACRIFQPALFPRQLETDLPVWWNDVLRTLDPRLEVHDASGMATHGVRVSVDLADYALVELDPQLTSDERSGCMQGNLTPKQKRDILDRVADLADRALDPLRLKYCHYRRLEYLPQRAGELDDGDTVAYLWNPDSTYDPVLSEPRTAIRPVNNWLGLRVTDCQLSPHDAALAALALQGPQTDTQGRLRAALRLAGQALYNMYPEASFMSLVAALEGLADPEGKSAKHHSYVAAFACGDDVRRYERFLTSYWHLYQARNEVAHTGGPIELEGMDPLQVVQEAYRLLGLAIENVEPQSGRADAEIRATIESRLRQPEWRAATRRVAESMMKQALQADPW